MAFLAAIPAIVSAVASAAGAAGAISTTAATVIAGAATLAGAAVQGISSYQTNKQNAAYAKAEGKQAEAAAQEEAVRQRRQVAALQGTLRAQAGAQGTTFDGSPMEVYLENAKQGELMAQDSLYRGRLRRIGANQEAANYNSKALAGTLSGVGDAAKAGAQLGSLWDGLFSGGGSSISPSSYSLEGGGGLLSTYSVNGLAKPRYSING